MLKVWKKEEVDFLINNHKNYTRPQLAASLNRSLKSVSCKLHKLDLRLDRINTTHGMTNTRFYDIWHSMKQRCNGTLGAVHTKLYKDRGIHYDPRWERFENFKHDMYKEYKTKGGDKAKLMIDRINTNGDYEVNNCRWVTSKENANNKRNNVIIEGKTISEWCDYLKLNKRAIAKVYKRHSAYGAKTYDELFTDRPLITVRTEEKSKKPCIVCGTTKGSLDTHSKRYPRRIKGMCNTCYCRSYKQNLTKSQSQL